MAPQPFLVALGQAVRARRTERGLSQEELSLRSGVHRNYIGGLERAERRPSVLTVVRLAEALEVPASDLITDARPMPRLHRGVVLDLIAEITSGRLPEGAELPREVDLARRYGVSRGVARERRSEPLRSVG